MKVAVSLIALCGLALSGCGNPFSSRQNSSMESGFRPGLPGGAAPAAPTPAPQANIGGKNGFKLGPGSLRAVGVDIGAALTITRDRVPLQSGAGQVHGSFSLSRSRAR